MSTAVSVITIVAGVSFAALVAGVAARRRTTTGRLRSGTENEAPGAAVPSAAASKREEVATVQDPRVERVKDAYANGEIDERMLGTAARVLGIDKDEARRRLEGAGNAGAAGIDPAERERKRAKTRAQNRKKNKQSKKSRQANRR
jgi:hypothetical protein